MNSSWILSQELTLKITSKITSEKEVLDKIDFTKKHADYTSLINEVDIISSYLKKLGYFTNSIDSIKKEDNTYTTYFTLHKKVKNAIILIDEKSRRYFKGFKFDGESTVIPIEKLERTLINISKKLDIEGKSFSKAQLKNILIKGENLIAELEIHQSKKRNITKVVIKGYKDFPKSFLKNYFNIHKNTTFNKQKIKEISNLSKNLQFAKEIKSPEILFTKDSTLLYMYLKKNQNSSFDGIINFASNENGSVLLNGNIDLKLNNILNTGEKLNLFWNSIQNESQEFKILTEIPYIFNSKFSPEISFGIYKQDSTFLNINFNSKIFFNINTKTKLALTYSSKSSESLNNITNNNIETFNNYFIGTQFRFTIPKNDFFYNDKFSFEINPTFGLRKTNQNKSNQFKIEAITSYIWDISTRNSIFIKNKTGYLNSDFFLENELFRIGGANSIRGFNEQSIFTNNFAYFNLEYRLLTSEKSYLYTITDFAKTSYQNKNNNFLGLGFGYLFKIKNSFVNLGYAIGKRNHSNFNQKNSKLIINWKSLF